MAAVAQDPDALFYASSEMQSNKAVRELWQKALDSESVANLKAMRQEEERLDEERARKAQAREAEQAARDQEMRSF